MKVPVSIRIDEKLYDQAKDAAASQSRSFSNFAEIAVAEKVQRDTVKKPRSAGKD